MKIIKDLNEFIQHRRQLRQSGRTIGFVPTMGALHRGHLRLVEESTKANDVTVVSIFVNPTQFGPNEDFDSYPRDLESDSAKLAELGVGIVFSPPREQLYPEGFRSFVEVEELSKTLCGASRPGHFRGVTTIVLKLLNIVSPRHAYFGRKDAQQAIIIKKMAEDLNLDTEIRTIAIERDSDGLALSSRNVYLSKEERQAALTLPQALKQARKEIEAGLVDSNKVRENILQRFSDTPLIKVDYVEVVTLNRLERSPTIDTKNTLVAGAVFVGKTRLIDNFILGDI